MAGRKGEGESAGDRQGVRSGAGMGGVTDEGGT